MMESDREGQEPTVPGGLELVESTEERIVGPVSGRYLACYVVRTKNGFVAYAKICLSIPDCPWSAAPGRKASSGPYETSEEAFEAVIAKCTEVLNRSPHERLRILRMFMKSGR